MKKLAISILLTASAGICQAQSAADEKALVDMEKQLTEAIASHKVDFLNRLFDDRYYGVTPAGTVVDKTKWLQLLNTNNPYVIFNTDDVKATVHGTTAIVTGKLIGKSKTGTIIGKTRFIHVLVKRNDQWKIIAEQGTVVIQE